MALRRPGCTGHCVQASATRDRPAPLRERRRRRRRRDRLSRFLIGMQARPAAAPLGDGAHGAASRRPPRRTGHRVLGYNALSGRHARLGSPEADARPSACSPSSCAFSRRARRGFFVPGNHDWDGMQPGRLGCDPPSGRFMPPREAGAVLLPAVRLPRPAVVDLGDVVRLVALDSQWCCDGPSPAPRRRAPPH